MRSWEFRVNVNFYVRCCLTMRNKRLLEAPIDENILFFGRV